MRNERETTYYCYSRATYSELNSITRIEAMFSFLCSKNIWKIEVTLEFNYRGKRNVLINNRISKLYIQRRVALKLKYITVRKWSSLTFDCQTLVRSSKSIVSIAFQRHRRLIKILIKISYPGYSVCDRSPIVYCERAQVEITEFWENTIQSCRAARNIK